MNLNTSFSDGFERVASFCGAAYCPTSENGAKVILTSPPDHEKIVTLSGIFLALMISACIIVVLFVDPLKRYEIGRKGPGSDISGFQLMAVTLKQLLNLKQVLLLPITMFIGAEQAFIAADFTSVKPEFQMFNSVFYKHISPCSLHRLLYHVDGGYHVSVM